MSVTIRGIRSEDKAAWRALWNGYNQFFDCDVPEAITENTWRRLHDSDSTIDAIVAEVNGELAGFAMYVLHEGTWVKTPICYLEDLFVAERFRGHGVGRQLIQALKEEGNAQGWSRLYWHTATNNPARKLYDTFIAAGDYVRYRIDL